MEKYSYKKLYMDAYKINVDFRKPAQIIKLWKDEVSERGNIRLLIERLELKNFKVIQENMKVNLLYKGNLI